MKEKVSEVSPKEVLKFFWKYIYKYLWHTIIICITYAIGLVLRIILSQKQIGNITDAIFAAGTSVDVHILIKGVALFALLVILSQLVFRVGDYLVVLVQTRIQYMIHNDVFGSLVYKPVALFVNNFSGSLTAQARRAATGFETFYDVGTWQLWTGIVVILGSIVAILVTQWQVGVILIAWLIIYGIVVYFSLSKQRIAGNKESAQDSQITGILSDVFTNIFAVKAWSAENAESEYFRTETKQLAQLQWNLWILQNIQLAFHGFSTAIVQILILSSSIYFWYKGIMTPGDIVAIQLYIQPVPDRVREFSRLLTKIIESISKATQIVGLLQTPSDELLTMQGKKELTGITGVVSLANVSFVYNENPTIPVLKNISLTIPAGQKIGVVGKSGAGKSTLVSILLRFYDVKGGTISFDDKNIYDYSIQSVRQNIAYVPQEPILFHRTIRENILYGQKQDQDSVLNTIAKRANLSGFIKNLPEKFDTFVGERGVKLSGGQRQRIAIARAMAKDAPILILDEATSALDSEGEQIIQEAFDELMKDRTTIVIAHRLSTLKHMDRIIVLDEGIIAEDGTHEELLAKQGIYSSLWSHQTNGFIE